MGSKYSIMAKNRDDKEWSGYQSNYLLPFIFKVIKYSLSHEIVNMAIRNFKEK